MNCSVELGDSGAVGPPSEGVRVRIAQADAETLQGWFDRGLAAQQPERARVMAFVVACGRAELELS